MAAPTTDEVRVEKNGITYRASWRVEKAMLIVDYSDPIRSVQRVLPLEGRAPAELARSVLDEIIDTSTRLH